MTQLLCLCIVEANEPGLTESERCRCVYITIRQPGSCKSFRYDLTEFIYSGRQGGGPWRGFSYLPRILQLSSHDFHSSLPISRTLHGRSGWINGYPVSSRFSTLFSAIIYFWLLFHDPRRLFLLWSNKTRVSFHGEDQIDWLNEIKFYHNFKAYLSNR